MHRSFNIIKCHITACWSWWGRRITLIHLLPIWGRFDIFVILTCSYCHMLTRFFFFGMFGTLCFSIGFGGLEVWHLYVCFFNVFFHSYYLLIILIYYLFLFLILTIILIYYLLLLSSITNYWYYHYYYSYYYLVSPLVFLFMIKYFDYYSMNWVFVIPQTVLARKGFWRVEGSWTIVAPARLCSHSKCC
jgi:hypothetical protein